MITLKEFIKDTLSQIVDATSEFDEENRDENGALAKANPAIAKGFVREELWGPSGMIPTRWRSGHDNETGQFIGYATMIDFDVAVTVHESDRTSGQAGAKIVSVFSAGGERSNEVGNTSVSRIRFKVPLEVA